MYKKSDLFEKSLEVLHEVFRIQQIYLSYGHPLIL